MRIVDRKTFLSLPENTIFSCYNPCYFKPVSIKGDSIEDIDFYYCSISDAIEHSGSYEFDSILDKATEDGSSIKMDFNSGIRDGCFDDELFAVWEKKDIEQLINKLKECLKVFDVRNENNFVRTHIEITDDKIDEIIHSLHLCAKNEDSYELGLPIDDEYNMNEMRTKIKNILSIQQNEEVS